jgi:phage FluMu protein Com
MKPRPSLEVNGQKEEVPMDGTRCPICQNRLLAMTNKTGRTELRCPKCDHADPMKTEP